MNDNEIGNPPIKALIVFRENGDTDNLFVPILYDAIRTTGIDVRCSTNEFWNSDTPYDIIHFQWPEEVMEGNCDDPDRICRLAGYLTRNAVQYSAKMFSSALPADLRKIPSTDLPQRQRRFP